MARTKKAATKTTVKTASVSETPAKSVVTTSEENAVKAETPKTDDAKVSVETKAAEKPVETKPAETKTVEEKPVAAEVEEPAKKPAAKKTVRKTTTAKKTRKTTAKKTETVTEVYVQYWGKEIHTSEVADRIRKIWTDDMGKKASDLKDLKIYIKPEDNGAHYVINGDVTGLSLIHISEPTRP